MELSDLIFSPLSEESPITTFDCGLEDITSFLHDDALPYQDEKMANTYLFEDEKGSVFAFFSISNDCLNDLDDEHGYTNNIWNRLHRFLGLSNIKRIRQYPAIKIGRLGVHKDLQGSGIAYQLMDFIKGWFYSASLIQEQGKSVDAHWNYNLPEIYFIAVVDFRFAALLSWPRILRV